MTALTRTLLFLGLTVLLFSNCKEEPIMVTEPEGNITEEPIETTEPSGDENYLTLDSEYIFDQSKLPTFELTISPAYLSNINNDPSAEQYVEGSLTFEGETIHPVGVRYKGSVGGFVGCLSGGGFNPSGYKVCSKLSMKIKINWEGRTDKFYGLKKLQLHSMNQDPSQMRDRLGYWLFDQMGVDSPRAVHARLMINGEYAGLFILVEQIDGRFAKYHFDDDEGNIYKEVWPLNANGHIRNNFEYAAGLKTNEDENPSFDIIKGLAADVKDAEDDDALKAAVQKWMDLDKIMSYSMVDRTIKHDDGPFHWYCFGNCEPHNFYFLEEPNNQKIHLIPWDLDNAFQNINGSNGVTDIPDDWGETRNDCNPFTTGFLNLQQKSAACDKLTKGWTLFEDEFVAKKQAFIEGPFSEESINTQLDTWSAQIRAATVEAQEAFSDAISVQNWDQNIGQLKNQCSIARSQ